MGDDEMREGLRRRLIVIDGPDGCGKTTVLAKLAQLLACPAAQRRGRDDPTDVRWYAPDQGDEWSVVRVREPGGTPYGEAIRNVLLTLRGRTELDARAELFLFMAARAQLLADTIMPALDVGHVVLADRFLCSSVAYQGFGRQLGTDVVREMAKALGLGALPWVTIVLDVPRHIATARQSEHDKVLDRIEREAEAFQRRVRLGYLWYATHAPGSFLVDASSTPEYTMSGVVDALKQVAESGTPLHCLW